MLPIIASFFSIIIITACGGDTNRGSSQGASSAASASASASYNSSSRDITSDSGDAVANTTFANTVYLNLTTPSWSIDNSTFTAITSTAATITDGITIKASSGYITINAASSTGATCIQMTGTLSAGTVAVKSNASYAVELYLNGATITSGNYPCIEVTSASRTFVVLNGTNTLTDGRTFGCGYGSSYASTSTNYVASGEDTKGSLYSKGQMLFSGSGSLTVNSAYKHCIYSKDYIRVFGGTITTKNSGRNAIQSVNGFIMDEGTITMTGTGTNIDNQSRGIVVEGAESSTYCGEGFIVINGGTITGTTVSKGITAKWDIDEDAETAATTDDPYPYVRITGGTISLTTTGTPKDDYTATSVKDADGVVASSATVSLSPEGIEGKEAVFISGGTLTLKTTDDCINASNTSGSISISGGTIYAFSSDNDAIDSNGTLAISGGTIVAMTTTNPECAFDCDANTFSITGGLLVGMGSSNFSAPTTSACTQNSVVMAASYAPAGATLAIASGSTPVFAFSVPALSSIASTGGSNTYDVLVFSSPKLASNTTYTVYNSAAVTGSTCNGLYTSLSGTTSGTSRTTFTTSSTVTTVGSVSNGGATEGPHP
jgi:hypothetical protein